MDVFAGVSQSWLAWITAASWQLALLVCLIALVSRAARAASPRLRHGLWLLVLAKVFLPPGLTAPWSIGHWAVAPAWEAIHLAPGNARPAEAAPRRSEEDAGSPTVGQAIPVDVARRVASSAVVLLIGWTVGCLLFWGIVGWRYLWLLRATRFAPVIDEGPVRVALEQLALRLGLRRVPELLFTNAVTSPFLFGVTRPRIVLPEQAISQLNDVDLRAVLTHELVHWQRYDTWLGWLQVCVQSIFWFHPFVWWANAEIRHERERVCDETVLRLGQISPQHYGESIIHVLTAARGRSLVAGSLVGVFERGANLQNRLEDIMNYESIKRGFGWPSRLTLAALAILLLPMAPGVVASGLAEQKQEGRATTPQIVKSTPKVGATGVDPALREITVVFDRDMGKGMSWTGGPPLFPPTDDTRKAQWTDARTCVIPVKLAEGSYYRLGINSKSHQNFRSSDGVAAAPSSLYFVTRGATPETESRVRAPEIVALEPKNGAQDVDPKTATLRVTFNMPMGEGMSWTGGGATYPKISAGQQPTWSADGLTCTLPVTLEAGHDYQLGLNSVSHINFQSKWGVALKPVVYKFRTQDAK